MSFIINSLPWDIYRITKMEDFQLSSYVQQIPIERCSWGFIRKGIGRIFAMNPPSDPSHAIIGQRAVGKPLTVLLLVQRDTPRLEFPTDEQVIAFQRTLPRGTELQLMIKGSSRDLSMLTQEEWNTLAQTIVDYVNQFETRTSILISGYTCDITPFSPTSTLLGRALRHLDTRRPMTLEVDSRVDSEIFKQCDLVTFNYTDHEDDEIVTNLVEAATVAEKAKLIIWKQDPEDLIEASPIDAMDT